MNLYHFFDKRTGPFKSLSALAPEEAEAVLKKVQRDFPNSQCAQRDAEYVAHRRNCESMLRKAFAAKGGVMEIASPHYMVVEFSPWLSTWFEQCGCIKAPVERFDLRTVSFTYGDSMPTFSDRCADGREYRKQVYTYDEIVEIIKKYDLPQNWNDDGKYGPERYIEVHVWSDKTVNELKKEYFEALKGEENAG